MNIFDRAMTYPEAIRFRLEDGMSNVIVRAAQERRISVSEYVRTAVRTKLTADGVRLPELGRHDAA